MSRQVEAVIFDLDDTLLDWSQQAESWEAFTRPMVDRVYHYLLDKGHPLPQPDEFFSGLEREIRGVWDEAKLTWSGARFQEALQRTFAGFGLPVQAIEIDEVMRVYGWRPMPGVVPFPDAFVVLDNLQAQQYRLGLVTNSFFPMWMRDIELSAYRLLDYFDARITSGDAGYMKPHPAIYQRMLTLLDVPASRAVFVGDRPENDIAGANDAGLISILMSPAHLDRDLNGVQPDYTITTLSELLPILAELKNSCSNR